MIHVSRARVMAASVALAGTIALGFVAGSRAADNQPNRAAAPPAQQVAVAPARVSPVATGSETVSVDELKTEAFQALRNGKFERTNELLTRAASLSHDPSVERMAGWTHSFEAQREEFTVERHKQYEKAAAHVRLLLEKHHPDYAIDAARNAYLLADDKEAFRHEDWIDQLVRDSIHRAENYDKNEDWVKALRIYSDLGAIEPSAPEWKEKLKLCTRRVRLLALYTPDVLKHLQDGEQTERDEVEQLLRDKEAPTTQPVKAPETQPADDNDSFKVDWRETLRGIRLPMLWDALVDAKSNYYRDCTFKTLSLGGLNGLETLVSTKGLEKAFPGLADAAKKADFVKWLDEQIAANRSAPAAEEQLKLRTSLVNLLAVNRRTVQIPEEVLVSEFADGAFGELDPFSSMIWPSDLEEFNKTTQGEFSGVGIQIQSDQDGGLRVVSPLEDTPAYKAGIKAGDIITRINGKNAKGISINQAVRTITGPSGSTVVLTVKSPEGVSRDYTIRRETIKVASVKGWLHKPGGGWDWMVDRENKIAYLRMTNFTKDTPHELEHALDQIKEQGGRALVLDLRYNPGGLLTSATEVADKFLKEGVIVSTRPDRDTGNQPTVALAKPDDNDCELPLIVLVNQYSASASEIVSGALKDQKHRATIIGERTFGKGSVQMLFPLADRSAYLKLTTSHYYLPSGRCIHREENSKDWGVDPDIKVEMTPEQMRAAIDARQDLDVLRDASAPAGGEQPKLEVKSQAIEIKTAKAKPKRDLLGSDPQLAAGLLWLKLELAGAPI